MERHDREEMIWIEGTAAVGGEERSDDPSTAEAAAVDPAPPDPEVVAKPPAGYLVCSRVSTRLTNSSICDFCSSTVSRSFRSASAT